MVTEQYGGRERLKDATDRTLHTGVRAGIIFSQRLWNLATLTPELREKANRWVIRTEAGAPVVEAYHHHHYGGIQWDHHFAFPEYVMCPAVPEWQEFALDNLVGVIKASGYETLFYDQGIEEVPCHNPGHLHSDPNAPLQASHRFLQRLRDRLREANPNALLISEGIELLASQAVDLGWSWVERRKPNPSQSNPEVSRYTLPWFTFALPLDDDVAAANHWFALGVHLAFIPRSLESGKKLSDFPEFARHLRRLIELRHRQRRRLSIDRFIDDVGINSAGAFVCAYAGATELAVVAANLSDMKSIAEIEIDANHHDLQGTSFQKDSTESDQLVGQAERRGSATCWKQTLQPYEVAVYIFERNG
jgi:hypothetical protein